MSRSLLTELFMLQTKAVVNAYTWTTLPLYAAVQRPWRRLAASKSFGVQRTTDSQGRLVYSRPCRLTKEELEQKGVPFLGMHSFNQMVPLLDRSKEKVGVRRVLEEQIQLDSATGRPIKVDGRTLKKVKLAPAFEWFTVAQVMERVDALARGLQAMGVSKRTKVIIFADNSLEWLCTALALQRLNACTVTLLSILNDEGILYGANQCQATFIVTSRELLPRLAAIAASLEHLQTVVYIDNKEDSNKLDRPIASPLSRFQLTTLDRVERTGTQLPPVAFPIPDPDDIALILYTSGTTGAPKGVLLSYRNLTETVLNLLRIEVEMNTPLLNAPSSALYLPLGHIFGLLMSIGTFVSPNSRVALCSPMTMLSSSPAHVNDQKGDFLLAKPNFMGSVPLVLDRITKEVRRQMKAKSPLAIPLLEYLVDYKARWAARGYDTPIINRLLCRRINEKFGGHFQTMLVGSAPISDRTHAAIQSLMNIKVLNAYGCTEASAGSTIQMAADLTTGHTGVPFHSVKYYLKDWPEGGYSTNDQPNPRGEIVIGGPTVSQGYFKMAEQTAESFKVDPDGTRWFETGDIAEVLSNGCLRIIDRRKDLQKLANGEFVSLGKIESALRSSPFVENVCICSDPYSNHITGLVSPNRRALVELAQRIKKSHFSIEQLCTDDQVRQTVLESIRDTCKQMNFAPKEVPVVITLVPEEWTPDNLLTAALKMKRKQVNEFYKAQIKRMFEEANKGGAKQE